MQINLRIAVICYAMLLLLITISILRRGRMPEKYSLIWLALSLLIFLVGLVPNFVSVISEVIGFEAMSNMVIAIILVLLTFISIVLTIIVSGQKKKATLLIQEVSTLKKEVNELKEKNK